MSPSHVVDAYPLSPTQHGMLFHGIQHEHGGFDIEQMVATFRERIDVACLERAWGRVMAAHPVLRSRFRWEGLAEPRQEVLADLPTPFTFEDLTAHDEAAQTRAVETYLEDDRRRGFDFAAGPLWRVALFQTVRDAGGDDVHRFVFTYSHALLDGCVSAVLREVYACYDAYRRGEEPVLEPRRPYRDHIAFLAEHLPARAAAARAFWRDLLAGFTSPTKLDVERPALAPRAANGGGETLADYGSKVFGVARETSDALRAIAKEHGLNVPIFVEAAWAILLSAFSGEDDVVFGSTRACRRTSVPGAEDTIGLFINTLPVRARLNPDEPLLDLLKRLRAQQQAIRAFEQTPLVEVQAAAETPRGAALFDTLIVFNGYHNDTLLRSWGGEWERRTFDWIDQTNFPVSLMGYGDARLHFKLSYDRARFDDATMDRFAATMEALLTAMARDAGVTVGALPRVTDEERQRAAETWNATQADVAPTCIHHAFEAQVARTPDAIAVAFRDRTLTYRQLDARADAVARALQDLGVAPDVRVGVFVERSLEMMIALMGILKAGGAYVPMDPTYPAERVAMMIEDARAPVIVTLDRLRAKLPHGAFRVLTVDASSPLAPGVERPASSVSPASLAYVIFTSGSTGRPKGVMLEHRNVTNFFAGMDARIGAARAGSTWLALTSISFDISVLELFWTLARGFTVVIQESLEEVALAPRGAPDGGARAIEFSLFYFASDAGAGTRARYRLLLEGAKFADKNGFTAVWTPERHFHPFGGLYPNPALTSAAVAVITERIQLRAGSVVLPLHNPIRCAEEWSVVDNLSNGRVGLSFASGWHASDFALAPENFAKRRERMWEGIETIRALWRGESVQAKSGDGSDVTLKMYPPPVQREPRIWITAGGSPETFTQAAKIGASILTNLLVMKHDDLVANIAAYRRAWRAAGHPGEGHVSLMLHTFVGRDLEEVRARVRGPFTEYLRTSTDLINKARWEQTAFAKAGEKPRGAGPGASMDLGDLSPDEMQAMMDHAFARYFETTGLFGTPSSCVAMVERLKAMGVDEIACLVDFGVDEDAVLESLVFLNELRLRTGAGASAASDGSADFSIAAQIRRHDVTHMQCTPSLAGMLAEDPEALAAMGTLEKLLLGGEALPAALAARLAAVVKGDLLNMYGPTETTIWSTSSVVDRGGAAITLGRPIANTEVYVVDRHLRPVPLGVRGELLIGGAGVARGYLDRPELTSERFVSDTLCTRTGARASGTARLYRTGDHVRLLPSGDLEFLGRLDHQVKIRGHRIELGEIETVLGAHPRVREAVVVARAGSAGDPRLVAYVVPRDEGVDAGGATSASGDGTAEWSRIWDETYKLDRAAASDDPAFDVVGWKSSYTGEPIPEGEMREWVETTAARVLELGPSRVLEIGCGTGMFVFRIAPRCASYTGLDFAPAALAGIRQKLDAMHVSNVALLEKRADQLAELPEAAFDTVVLNSVLQYFPDLEYLLGVLEQGFARLAPGGAFFVGDVRSLPLLRAFHTAIELERAPDALPVADLAARVETRVAAERELLVDPAFFEALRGRLPDLADVSIRLKAGRHHNELTRFRYDVVLRKRAERDAAPAARGASEEVVSSLDAVADALAAGAPTVRVANLRNPRLAREVHAASQLTSMFEGATVGDLRTAEDAAPDLAVDPDDAVTAVPLPFVAAATWARSGAVDRFDVVATRAGSAAPRTSSLDAPSPRPWSEYANRPVRSTEAGASALGPDLRAFLRGRLPEYMVPTVFVPLAVLPLTPNGKVDRKALPEPERQARASVEAIAPPSSDIERAMLGVWQDMLRLDQISTRDNLFDLGANSFLMVQASGRLRAVLGKPVSLVDMFRFPTIGALSAHLAEARGGTADGGENDASAQEGQQRAAARKDAMQRRRDVRQRAR